MLSFNIKKQFANDKQMHFIADITLQGVTTVFGDSGAGKTTLLRCLTGLESCQGYIRFQQQDWLTEHTTIATEKRNIGVVFQEPRLFPHLNVQKNLQLALNKQRQCDFDINDLAKQLGFESLLLQHPSQLSGGQKQRVAIARALLSNPQLLVMDEPLSSLDEASKNLLLPFIKQLSTKIPIIYISHSIAELFYLSQQMILVNHGQVEAVGLPQQLFLDSSLSLVKYAHEGMIVELKRVAYDKQDQLLHAQLDGQDIYIASSEHDLPAQLQVKINSRDVVVAHQPILHSSLLNSLHVQLVDFIEVEQHIVLTLKLTRQFIYARITKRSFNSLKLKQGSYLYAHVKTMGIIC